MVEFETATTATIDKTLKPTQTGPSFSELDFTRLLSSVLNPSFESNPTLEPTQFRPVPVVRINQNIRAVSLDKRIEVFREGILWRGFFEFARQAHDNPGKIFSGPDMDQIATKAGSFVENHPGSWLASRIRLKIENDSKRPALLIRSGSPKNPHYQFEAHVEFITDPLKESSKSVVSMVQSPEMLKALDMAAISKTQKGHPEAFGELYDRYQKRIYRYIFKRISHPEEAEDLTSQVFLNALTYIKGYQFMDRPFVVWLLKIAHNLLVDRYRAKKGSKTLDEVIISSDHNTDPEFLAERNIDYVLVREAIGKLTEDQQLVVKGRFLKGMGYSEIASILNKSEGSIRIMLHRSLLKLRRLLKQQMLPLAG